MDISVKLLKSIQWRAKRWAFYCMKQGLCITEDDLFQSGILLALEHVKDFDSDKGKFESYFYIGANLGMKDAIRRNKTLQNPRFLSEKIVTNIDAKMIKMIISSVSNLEDREALLLVFQKHSFTKVGNKWSIVLNGKSISKQRLFQRVSRALDQIKSYIKLNDLTLEDFLISERI